MYWYSNHSTCYIMIDFQLAQWLHLLFSRLEILDWWRAKRPDPSIHPPKVVHYVQEQCHTQLQNYFKNQILLKQVKKVMCGGLSFVIDFQTLKCVLSFFVFSSLTLLLSVSMLIWVRIAHTQATYIQNKPQFIMLLHKCFFILEWLHSHLLYCVYWQIIFCVVSKIST